MNKPCADHPPVKPGSAHTGGGTEYASLSYVSDWPRHSVLQISHGPSPAAPLVRQKMSRIFVRQVISSQAH